jgi:hypothetical protein
MKKRITENEEARIKYAIKNKVMHFSPTISPAPKNFERNEIESLEKAIIYYYDAGQERIIIQPKYMGSYCDIYLGKNIEDTRFFSRKGFPLPSFLDKQKLIDAVKPLWMKFENDFNSGLDLVLVQSELVPWSCLGKGLIEREFRGYEFCHQTYLDYVKDTGLYEELKRLSLDSEYEKYLDDSVLLSKEELRIKYPNHIIAQYNSQFSLDLIPVEEYQKDIDLYHSQVLIYGGEGEPEFMPFNILKMVYDDGTENIMTSNILSYQKVGKTEPLIISFKDFTLEQIIQDAYRYFHYLTDDCQMEGVIVKPDDMWINDLAPMFKVRNNKYLQMIYGVSFARNYSYYLQKRNVSKKIKCSINEWNISKAMVKIPISEICNDNERYKQLIKVRITEEQFEETLDSRL